MMKFIGYYASFQGDRVIVNEDNSVIVFGKKHDFISYHENHPEKVTGTSGRDSILFNALTHCSPESSLNCVLLNSLLLSIEFKQKLQLRLHLIVKNAAMYL